MKRKVILHAHFYQPCREHPISHRVPLQDGAFPFYNWNEKITYQCYLPNSCSRILDSDGKIVDIVNNYENISFNFGPTLFDYLEKNNSSLCKRIIQADKKSLERLGHGNAIAQGYNHTILPLDTKERKSIQIKAGLSYFKKVFGRDSEGFWCPECAINRDTIDELYLQGIKFVILSPLQIKEIVVAGKRINPSESKSELYSHPFYIKGHKFKLAAFFYDANLSSAISFSHLLTSADNLMDKINDISIKTKKNIVIAATDGEIYGHHEPFADMCLAYLSKIIKSKDEWEFTNFATVLVNESPIGEALLYEEGKAPSGSSWSCCHGIERWRSDCGCQTGSNEGWNQKWRGPLRYALENVYSSILEQIKNKYSNYLELLLDFAGCFWVREEFYKKHNLSNRDKDLFEAYFLSNCSFTSCGWFFNDISGIEPRHNILLALQALRLLNLDTAIQNFISDLGKAKGNIGINGDDIAKEELEKLEHYDSNFDFREVNKKLGEDIASIQITPSLIRHIVEKITYIEKNNLFDNKSFINSGYLSSLSVVIIAHYINKGNIREVEREEVKKVFKYICLNKDSEFEEIRINIGEYFNKEIERIFNTKDLNIEKLLEIANILSWISKYVKLDLTISQNYMWNNRDKLKKKLKEANYKKLLAIFNFNLDI